MIRRWKTLEELVEGIQRDHKLRDYTRKEPIGMKFKLHERYDETVEIFSYIVELWRAYRSGNPSRDSHFFILLATGR